MRGYRFFLLPTSNGAPPNIARHIVASPWMKGLTFHQANPHSENAAKEWWKNHARPIIDECSLEVEGERRRSAAAVLSPATATRPAASPAGRSPVAQVAAKPAGPGLPQPLSQLLARPNDKLSSQPNDDFKELIALAFLNLRVMRCWEENDRGERRIDYLDRKPYCMQLELKARGFEAVYGGGHPDGGDEYTMEDHGLHQMGGGAFNGVWEVRSRNDTLNALLPEEVVEPFVAGKVVLRTPFGKTEWSTFDEAVGEATNMLFAARWRFGPRVAALSFARKVFFDEAPEEGTPVVKYKIFAWLERATMSVDKRFADATKHSAATNSTYYDALLEAVYQMSYQGFVHCDATLRNFVDFYGAELPTTIKTFAIKVIDVEPKTFRRLHPIATTEWRHLFLFNLLTVLVFLKIRLGGRWRTNACWLRVRAACRELISELPGTDSLAATTIWTGTYDPAERFPDLSLGEYAGETTEATSLAVMCLLKFYLLKQPLEEGRGNYCQFFFTKDEKELPNGKRWYDNVYRTTKFPARHFFLQRFHNHRAPEPFVQVAFDFLDTPHQTLLCAAPKLHCSNNHRVGMSESDILGSA